MIKIPYGKSDYKTLIENNYFYQDRTSYIQTLENTGATYLMYLRPRRFGKSLWISTLNYYYGLQYHSEFEKLFGHTFIGKNPTSNANKYLILKFDFSGINTTHEKGIYDGFLSNTIVGVGTFLEKYSNYFTDTQPREILTQSEPQEIIKKLFYYLENSKLEAKIYILIDEYDHFANELISFNFSHFSDIVTKNGYVRKFYEVIKIATSQGLVERIFMTGVSPITVDSLTSGFNISRNISLSPTFHQMVGFEEEEVAGILAGIEIPTEHIAATLADLKLWYNGYSFSPNVKTRLYNPNMVLYFAEEYAELGKYPREMLDTNIATDFSKIQKLFNIQGNFDKHSEILLILLETGEVVARLTSQYSFEREFTPDDLVSLLFYMGFLTIKKEHLGVYTFSFPNYVIKKLYADYFLKSIAERNVLKIDNRSINNAIINLAETGDPTPFFIEVQKIIQHFSPRDAAHFNENTLKAIIISLLHQQNFYYIHSEYETDWKYMDIYLEPIRGQQPQFEIALELKYIAKSGEKALSIIFEAALNQLKGYLDTPIFSLRTNIKAFVVVCVGNRIEWRTK